MFAIEQGTEMVTVGVIGCGVIAQLVHLPNLMQMTGVKVEFLCDVNEYRLGTAQRRFGVRIAVRNTAELLTAPNVDAVVIATEDVTHFELVMMALKHGKHVFVEKPICLLPEQADTIVQYANRAGLIVAVGFQKLYDRSFSWLSNLDAISSASFLVSVRDICHDNDLVLSDILPPEMLSEEFVAGRTDYSENASWQSIVESWLPGCPADLASTYRVFLNLACHDLSVVMKLFGEPTGVRYAEFSTDSTRRGLVVYEFGTGCRCVLEVGLTLRSWFDESVCIYAPDSTITIRWPSPFRLEAQSRAEVMRMIGRGRETLIYEANAGSAFADELVDFVRAVGGQGQPRGSAEHASKVLRWQVNAIEADIARRRG
jgi:predicted dehydrogenase